MSLHEVHSVNWFLQLLPLPTGGGLPANQQEEDTECGGHAGQRGGQIPSLSPYSHILMSGAEGQVVTFLEHRLPQHQGQGSGKPQPKLHGRAVMNFT